MPATFVQDASRDPVVKITGDLDGVTRAQRYGNREVKPDVAELKGLSICNSTAFTKAGRRVSEPARFATTTGWLPACAV